MVGSQAFETAPSEEPEQPDDLEPPTTTKYAIKGIQISDPDSSGTFTVTFTQTHGVLAVAVNAVGGLTDSAIKGNNSASVTLTGTLAQINATLAASNGLVLTADTGYAGPATLTMVTNDGQGGIDTDVVLVTVVAYNGTTPLILDLNNDGVRTLGTDAGVQFDITGSGLLASVGWSSPEDGFLVRDMNDDGLINDGAEMFGEATVLANGERAQDGFEALSDLDTNQDAVVDNQDEAFNSLAIWRDANTDGVTDAGELLTLAQHGIESLNLSYTESDRVDNGNQLRLVSNFTKTDGSQHEMVDVWLATFHENLSEAHMESALKAYVGAPEPTDRDASVSMISSSSEGTEADQSTIAMISAYNTTYEEDLINLESHRI